jgi:NAD(P)H-flavin reductase
VRVRLIANERETPTSRRIRLALESESFSYSAGQAATLSVGGEPTPYSIASAPVETARQGWLEFLIKIDGSTRFGSGVERLAPETNIDVQGPIGRFTMGDARRETPLLFVAGGTGIAPLRSMMIQALDEGHAAPISLVYSARRPDEFAFVPELKALEDRGRLSMSLTVTGPADDWAYARGRAGALHLAEHIRPGIVAFVCGPPAMVTEVPAVLESLGVSRNRIRTQNW